MSEFPSDAMQVAERSRFDQIGDVIKERRMALAAVAAAGALMIAGCGKSGSETTSTESVAQGTVAAEACNDIELDNVAFGYNGTFLPPSEKAVSNDNEAADYVKSWFEAPLGKEMDPASASLLWSITAGPALANSVDTNFDVQQAMGQAYNKLTTASTREEYSQKYCEELSVVLGSTVRYEENAISKGDKITTLVPVTADGKIARVEFVTGLAPDAIDGVTFKLRDAVQTVTINGKEHTLLSFTKIIVDSKGNIMILGPSPLGGDNTSKNAEGKSGNQPDDKKAPAGAKQNNDKNEGQKGKSGGSGNSIELSNGGGSNNGGPSPAAAGQSTGEQNKDKGTTENEDNGNIPAKRPGKSPNKPGKAPAQPGKGPSPAGSGSSTPEAPRTPSTPSTPGETPPTPPAGSTGTPETPSTPSTPTPTPPAGGTGTHETPPAPQPTKPDINPDSNID
jgi:hypothetical protein